MRCLRKLFSVIYFLIFVASGLAVLSITWQTGLTAGELSWAISFLSTDISLQVLGSFIALLFIFTGIKAPMAMARKMNKKRVVAFQNPDGEVTISLQAIEDYVKDVAHKVPYIADIRSKVNLSKKGINILSDITISQVANIPEVTESIQEQVKRRLQNILGEEENIKVKMHVKKILNGSKGEEDLDPRQVPFREID